MGLMRPCLLLAVGLCCCNAQLDTTVCTPVSPANTGPKRPVLPEMFSIRVECNLLSKKSTIDVQEWHDGSRNRGAATTWLSSVQLAYIYSYPTNQQLSFEQVAGGRYVCQVRQLDNMTQPYLHGTTNTTTTTTTSSAHIYSAARALSFGGSQPEQYEGKYRVRGMLADRWLSCVYWPDLNATMTVRWYFTVAEDWDTALGVAQTPVRCHVKGTVHTGSSARQFEHLYEVTEFYPYLTGGQQVFETPPGTVCPGRKETKDPPSLPPAFSYRVEGVNTQQQVTQFRKKAYDSDLSLAMREIVNFSPPRALLRIIDDFNTGVSYTIDREKGNCTVTSIDPNGFDAIKTPTALRMRTPQEFFFEPGFVYTYEGIRSARQLNTEVWVGTQSGPAGTATTGNSTWEYYFLTEEWQEGGRQGSAVPVSVQITRQRQQDHQAYNLYDFRHHDPGIWEYDVTSCFDNGQQFRYVQLTFPVTSAQRHLVSTNQRAFRRAVLTSMTSLVPISPMRVNNIVLQFRQLVVEVRMAVLEAVILPQSPFPSHLQLSLGAVMARIQEAAVAQRITVTVNTTGGPLTLVTGLAKTTRTPSTQTTPAAPSMTTAHHVPSSTTSSPPSSSTTTGHGLFSVLVCAPPASGRYTKGDVAGVAMGTAFSSYVLALVCVSVWTRWRSATADTERDHLEMSGQTPDF